MKKSLLAVVLAVAVAFSSLPVQAASAGKTASPAVSAPAASQPAQAATYTPNFAVNAKAVTLINLDTDTAIYNKNADQKIYPASTTKIMTYIVVMEHVKNIDTATATYSDKIKKMIDGTGSSTARLQVGDVFTIHDLLYAMLVPSGNDAALLLADAVGGGDISKFVGWMNEKAGQLGCTNTHFVNPNGLHDPNHYSTAHDMALITKYALSLNGFLEVTNTVKKYISPVGKPDDSRLLATTNSLIDKNLGGSLYFRYARGVKTGHTDEAGYCVISTAVTDGMSFLCVAMNAPQKGLEMKDSAALYRWAYRNFQLKRIATTTQALWEVDLKYALNKDRLLLMPEKDVYAILPNDVSTDSVETTPSGKNTVEAPVKQGQVLGSATLRYAKQELATVNLVSGETVARNEVVHTVSIARAVLSSPLFLGLLALIVVLLVLYIILAIVYNRRKRDLKRVRHYKEL